VAYGDSLFVAVGAEGLILLRRQLLDNQKFRDRQVPQLRCLGRQSIRRVGSGGIVLNLSRRIEVTARNSGTGSTLNGVVFTGAQFVAVGDNGPFCVFRRIVWTIKAM